MVFIFNHPLRRFLNFLNDGPFWQKIWLPTIKSWSHLMECQKLRIPEEPGAQSKHSDPNWRLNWNWVLLQSTGNLVYYPFCYDKPENHTGMTLIYPIKTRYFAVRVGDKPFYMFTLDEDGKVHVPKLSEKLSPMSKDEIMSLANMSGDKVTFI